jgi:NAD(P)-dependent dehydrogenase (short-subunit alcohol dehydrogenase family)
MTRTHHGRIAVISGAASGIGQASAERLAEEGARIVVADRENAKQTSSASSSGYYHERNEERFVFPCFRQAAKLVGLVDVLY